MISRSILSRRQIALGLVGGLVLAQLAIVVSGNFQFGKQHHPAWVNVVGWFGAACFYGLLAVGVATLWRRLRR